MSKFEEKFEKLKSNMDDLGLSYDASLLEKVAKGLGPALYNRDAESVSCSDSSELETVKKNFLMGKLGLSDGDELDAAIKEVCEKMGSSNRNKYRGIFYYLLVEKFNKASVY